GDGAGYGRARGREQEDQQVAGRGVQLERMARRGPERREDDAPWERRRPPVAAAGEKAADAADGERHQPCRDERVEQLARRPPCHARDDERRSQACRHATGGREPARPEHAASPVEEREKHVSADQGHRGDGRRGDQHGRRLARAADGEDRTRTDAEHDGEAVQRDDDLGAADDDAKRGEHAAGCKTRAGALRRVADSRTRALKQLLSVPCCTDHGTAPDGGSEERTPFTNRRASLLNNRRARPSQEETRGPRLSTGTPGEAPEPKVAPESWWRLGQELHLSRQGRGPRTGQGRSAVDEAVERGLDAEHARERGRRGGTAGGDGARGGTVLRDGACRGRMERASLALLARRAGVRRPGAPRFQARAARVLRARDRR